MVTLRCIIEGYYEIIKELIFVLIYKAGYNCSNHLCLISFLEEFFPNMDFEINKINELRMLRNDINYRGFSINYSYLEQNREHVHNIVEKLFSLN